MNISATKRAADVAAALTTNRLIQSYSPPDAPVPCSVSSSVESLLLVGREKRPNLRVELLENRVRLRPRFLMDGVELRSHGSYERFDLSSFVHQSVEHVRQHRGQVWRPVMAWRIVGCLRAGELCHRQRRPRHKHDKE